MAWLNLKCWCMQRTREIKRGPSHQSFSHFEESLMFWTVIWKDWEHWMLFWMLEPLEKGKYWKVWKAFQLMLCLLLAKLLQPRSKQVSLNKFFGSSSSGIIDSPYHTLPTTQEQDYGLLFFFPAFSEKIYKNKKNPNKSSCTKWLKIAMVTVALLSYVIPRNKNDCYQSQIFVV